MHVWRMALFNRRLYAMGAVAVVLGVLLAASGLPWWVRASGLSIAAVAGWFSIASLIGFFMMFDGSGLLEGEWLRGLTEPKRWVQISLGAEQTIIALDKVFPNAEGRLLDPFSESDVPAVAIQNARTSAVDAEPVDPTALPVDDGWADLVVVTLVVHEFIDKNTREALFTELRRILAPGGRLIVVDHVRNLPTLLTFGPTGWLHFMPLGELQRLFRLGGFQVGQEQSMSPFIRMFIMNTEMT